MLEAAYEPTRRQYEAGRIIELIKHESPTPKGATPRWVIGVTDVDIYWAEKGWRYAFSTRSDETGIISTARTRMAGEAPTLIFTRVRKLVTLMLGETYCGLNRGGPDHSMLRGTMMGLDDLDMLDEAVWTGPPTQI